MSQRIPQFPLHFFSQGHRCVDINIRAMAQDILDEFPVIGIRKHQQAFPEVTPGIDIPVFTLVDQGLIPSDYSLH